MPRIGANKKRYFAPAFVGLCAMALFLFWARSFSEEPAVPAAGATQTQSAIAASAVNKRSVERKVRALNRDVGKERQHFEEQGWAVVRADEPDKEVVSLDPAALGRKEALIADQLMSGSFAGDQLARVYDIARKAAEGRTRYAAVDALGRSHDGAAQGHLMNLYQHMDDAGTKAQIVPLVRPDSLQDERGRFLLDVAAAGGTDAIRGGAIGSLAVLCLRQGQDPESFTARLPEARAREFMDLYLKLKNGGGP